MEFSSSSKGAHKKGSANKNDSAVAADSNNDEDDDPFDSFIDVSQNVEQKPQKLLYPPLTVRTDGQRRIQAAILKTIVRSIATDFNRLFDQLKNEKENVMSQIEERNARIRDILTEVNIVEEVVDPSLGPLEIAEAVFYVNGEIPLSHPGQKNFAKEKHEYDGGGGVANDKKVGDENDAATRALIEMMDGTLEAKKKTVPNEKLERKEWMDKLTMDEMTPEQKKELENYERRLKENAEAIEEHRKAMELEMKKLKGEIKELTQNFDEKVQALSTDRFEIQKTIIMHEFHITQLAATIFRNEHSRNEAAEYSNTLKIYKNRKEASAIFLEKIQAELDRRKNELNKVVEEDKGLDKSFKKNIQRVSSIPLDQETAKLMFQLYKDRIEIHGTTVKTLAPSSNSVGRNSCGSNNSSTKDSVIQRRSWLGRVSGREGSTWASRNSRPSRNSRQSRLTSGSAGGLDVVMEALKEAQDFAMNDDTGTCYYSGSKGDPFLGLDDIKNTSVEDDCSGKIRNLSHDDIPEGFHVTDEVWEEVQVLRQEKISKEMEVKRAMSDFKEMKNFYDDAKNKDDDLQSSIETIVRKQRENDETHFQMLKNPQLLIQLKQGQDEIEKEAVITDYGFAMLTPLKIVHNTNTSILALNEEKMDVLLKTKNFRKRINFLKWNHELLQLKERDVNEQYTDWQLLRVTNQLKSVLSGAHAEENEFVKLKRSEAKLSKRQAVLDKKVARLNKEKKSLAKCIEERKKENEMLRGQLEELRNNVSVRDAIYENQLEATKSTENQNKRFKSITKRRKLTDLVHSNTAEIKKLTAEVDRLRQKTFPSFVHALQNRSGNPDER